MSGYTAVMSGYTAVFVQVYGCMCAGIRQGVQGGYTAGCTRRVYSREDYPGIQQGGLPGYTPLSRVHLTRYTPLLTSSMRSPPLFVEERQGPGLNEGNNPWVRDTLRRKGPKSVTDVMGMMRRVRSGSRIIM